MNDEPYVVRSLKQILVLASPGREDVLDSIGLIGPCSVPELARFLGRTRQALYYHVRALHRAGLLVETRHSGEGTKTTSRFDLPGRPLTVRYDLTTERARRAVKAIGRTRLRTATRGFLRACHPAVATIEGPQRNLWVAHWMGWLSPRELAEFNRLLCRLVNLLRGGLKQKGRHRKPHEFTFALAPVAARRGGDVG